MRRGRHAADDGSFRRSTGMAAGRGALLLGVAVVLGIVLLNAVDDTPSARVSTGDDRSTTTVAPEETTTTQAATTTTTVAARAPKDVKVLATNGTDVKGAARKATDVLRAAGYNVLAPVDARRADATSVYFAPGYEREAQAVASALALSPASVKALPTPPPVADLRGANVLVVVGPDVAGRLVGAGTATTTTTRAVAPTTTRAATASTTAAP